MSGQDLQVLPSEWAPQSGVMLTWPHSHSDWQPWLAQVEPVYVEIAGQILKREKLLIVCYDDQHMDHILELLRHGEANTSQLKCYVVPSNDTWSRDHGPITVIREGLPRLLDFTFNGWGGKYAAELDDQITSNMHRAGAFGTTPIEKIDMVLEGGSIEVNGAGSLLTTSRCLLSTKRNPNMGRSQIESELSRLFGVGNFLWLENGYLAGDDTDSHIDNLGC